MTNELFILTAKDFGTLVVMRDYCFGRDDPLAQILKQKLDAARVVFPHDVPENIATIHSRVTFSVNGRAPDTRVISSEGVSLPMGMYQPVTTQRGLALLGLAEGQDFSLTNLNGDKERVVLERVLYQPEAARREIDVTPGFAASAGARPALRLIGGVSGDRVSSTAAGKGHFDDPGPSAA